MAAFDFTGTLPQFKALISSSQLRARFNDIKTELTSTNPSGATLPDLSGASASDENKALTLNNGLDGYDLEYVFRSNADFVFDGGSPTSGQVLQFDGDGTVSAVSLSAPNAFSEQTTNFNIADGGRYKCDTSGGAFNATLTFATSSVDDEFIIEPTENADFEANAVTVVRNGSEEIAGDAANFVCDANARYFFTGDATGNWTVSIAPQLRA